MSSYLFHNLKLIDGITFEAREGYEVLVEGNRIREVADRPVRSASAQRIDLKGHTLMPGLIDAHVHVTATTLDLGRMRELPPSWVTASASHILRDMLSRGFTTVRDAGGADWGLKDAVEAGLLVGPRLFICGHILTPTGGNNDYRPRTAVHMPGSCCEGGSGLGRIVDGVAEVRRAARDELRKGADQVKFNASGGVAGPAGNADTINFSAEEVRALVEETDHWQTYAMAHAYTPRTIRRAVEGGVRSIEHGNLIDAETADLMVEREAFMVPTLSIYHTASKYGKDLGFPDHSVAKVAAVRDASLVGLQTCRERGVRIGHGSDLLGPLHQYQSIEFALKSEVLTPAEVLAAATATNAEILGKKGELGVIGEGAFADLLVVEGDPLRDLGLLQDPERHLAAIMKNGRFFKNEIDIR